MRNPINTSPGKGDKPRNCHNPKFRKNYSEIKWKTPLERMMEAGLENTMVDGMILIEEDKIFKKRKKK